jgi:1,5-anhydro-D-fructose reductase (1,5-anhydro-D-mannitol-forming)
MINLCLVGPGKVADRYLAPALATLAGVQLWSVVGRNLERTAAFAARHGAAAPQPVTADLAAALADPAVTAVLIASPDHLHAQQAVAALRAAKPTFVEKPIATESAAARAMVTEAEAAGLPLLVGHHLRWHAGHRALASALERGAIGQPLHIQVQWTYRTPSPGNWRSDGGASRWWALSAFGPHGIDLIRWWMMPSCGPLADLELVSGSPLWQSVNDETSLLIARFASGATAQFTTSVLFESPRRIEIYGSHGMATCLNTLGPEGTGTITLNGEPLPFTPVDPYLAEMEAFVRAVRGEEPLPFRAAEAAEALEQLLAASPCTLSASA